MILYVVDPDSPTPRRLEIAKPEVFFGKHDACDVVLASPKVSRRHARLVEQGGQVLVEDLKSTNGTFLDGNPVSGLQPVDGGVIQIGDFQVRIEASAAKADGVAEASKAPAAVAPAAVESDQPKQPAKEEKHAAEDKK